MQTLAALDHRKIRTFVDAWYGAQPHLTADIAQRKAADLAEAAGRDDLRELAENPLLLTTMALVHQRNVGLPRERAKLYDEAVKILLVGWQKLKAGQVPPTPALASLLADEGRLRTVLERLAYEVHRREQAAGARKAKGEGFSAQDALGLLRAPEYLGSAGLAEEFLDYVDQRAGLLAGQGGAPEQPSHYSFPHRTFQEYLAGCYLVSRPEQAQAVPEYFARAAEGDFWALAAQLGAEELLHVRRYGGLLHSLAVGLCPQALPKDDQEWRAALWSGSMAALLGSAELQRLAGSQPAAKEFPGRVLDRLQEQLDGPLPAIERAEAGRALGKLGDPRKWVTSVAAMHFCRVPAGPFFMGTETEEGYEPLPERPAGEVKVPYDYWLARYPVTQGQYREFVAAGGYGEARYWLEAEAAGVWQDGMVKHGEVLQAEPWAFGEPFSLLNHPVVGVSWFEALAFCRWLTERWRSLLPAGYGVGLPSEPEWEKAARGGLRLPPMVEPCGVSSLAERGSPSTLERENLAPQRRYPWQGEADTERMNVGETGIGTTSAVGVFPGGRSEYGCEELSGTVWEWTRSLKGGYPYPASASERTERENLRIFEQPRVLRGGSFVSDRRYARCALRNWDGPGVRDGYVGFRVALLPSTLNSENSEL